LKSLKARDYSRRWEDSTQLMLWKLVGGCELHSSDTVSEPVADSCEHGNEPSGSVKGREFYDALLLTCQQLKCTCSEDHTGTSQSGRNSSRVAQGKKVSEKEIIKKMLLRINSSVN
jgi:hypothetical protein